MIAYVIMVLKKINPLVQTYTFNENIWEWCQQSTELKTREGLNTLFQQVHREQRRSVTTAVKGLCTAEAHSIYIIPPPPHTHTPLPGVKPLTFDMVQSVPGQIYDLPLISRISDLL